MDPRAVQETSSAAGRTEPDGEPGVGENEGAPRCRERMASEVVPAEVYAARRQAAEILAGAEREASALRAGTQRELERARAGALADGLAEGRARSAAEVLDLARIRDAGLEGLHEEIVALAAAMAARILEREVAAPGEVAAMAARALGRMRDARRAVLRVSPDDLEAVSRDAALRRVAGGVRVEPDPALAPGDVRVVAPAGDVDARIATQLAALCRALGEVAR